jgi:hypothetical protein
MEIIKIYENKIHAWMTKREKRLLEKSGWIVFRILSKQKEKEPKRKMIQGIGYPLRGIHNTHESNSSMKKAVKGKDNTSCCPDITCGDVTENIFSKDNTSKLPESNKSKHPVKKQEQLTSREKYKHDILKKIYENVKYFFIVHKYGSKKYDLAVKYIEKYNSKYSEEQIVEAFKLADRMFYDRNIKFTPLKSKKKKMDIHEFFEFSKYNAYKEKLAGTKSLFKEYVKGEQHILDNFYNIPHDPFPKCTEAFINLFLKHTQRTVVDPWEEIVFIKFSRKVVDFCFKYGFMHDEPFQDKPYWKRVHDAIEMQFFMEGKTIKDVTWMLSSNFMHKIKIMLMNVNYQYRNQIERVDRIEKNDRERRKLGMSKRDFMLYEKGIIDKKGNPL